MIVSLKHPPVLSHSDHSKLQGDVCKDLKKISMVPSLRRIIESHEITVLLIN